MLLRFLEEVVLGGCSLQADAKALLFAIRSCSSQLGSELGNLWHECVSDHGACYVARPLLRPEPIKSNRVVFGPRLVDRLGLFEEDSAGLDPTWRRRHEPEDREGGHRFPTARLADQPHRFARPNFEVDPLERFDGAFVGVEVRLQSLDAEDDRGGQGSPPQARVQDVP